MKSVLVTILVLSLVLGVQADILTSSGVESGFETSSLVGGHQISAGFGIWTDSWPNVDWATEYTASTGIAAHRGGGYFKVAGGGTRPCVVSAKVNATKAQPYTFGCWIKIGTTKVPTKVEFGFDQFNGGAWIGQDIIEITPTTSWAYYEHSTTCWENSISPKVAPFGPAGVATGVLYTDDWKLFNPDFVGQATNPVPANGASVPLNMSSLSWINPDPMDPNDTISCNVYVGTDPNFLSPYTASGITTGTVNLASLTPSLSLADGPTYYWRVDSVDPNSGGGPVTTPSAVWTFKVGNVPPVANAGANKYLWLAMPDGDGDPAKVTFTVTGTYTDDGKSPITRAEWVQGTHEGGGTVTKVGETWTPGTSTVSATFSATANGWLFLTLEVEDISGTGSDTMNVGVYLTCAEAATEDPADPYDATGDFDGNCKKDLADFAIFAAGWLEQSVKY